LTGWGERWRTGNSCRPPGAAQPSQYQILSSHQGTAAPNFDRLLTVTATTPVTNMIVSTTTYGNYDLLGRVGNSTQTTFGTQRRTG
jgi:hypothetical protein